MRVRFWGTRGSLAVPGPTTLRYGGNTACVEIETKDGQLIVLDCGTGAHLLGQALVSKGRRPLRGHMLITHTHWDHIQGFPFFAPLFVPANEWDLYAPQGLSGHLERTLAGQMEYTYFPVTLDELGATIRCHDLLEGSFMLGGVRVIARYLNHPALTLGYRLEIGGVSVVYATDHEPHARPEQGTEMTDRAGMLTLSHHEDRQHVEFLAGADLVIHDAQYTAQEYTEKMGWGHTPAETAVDFALAAGAKRLALFHHDPLRSDGELDKLQDICRKRAGSTLDVFAAEEGQQIALHETRARGLRSLRSTGSDDPGSGTEIDASTQTVLIVDDDPDIVLLLTEVLQPEGFRLLTASDGETGLHIARAARPSLMLLDWRMPGMDGLDVCRALRAEADPQLRDLPIVLLTANASPDSTAEAFEAGATDYLTKPFTVAIVRTRVHAWLLRSQTWASSST